MASFQDIFIVNSNTAAAQPVEAGSQRVLCSPDLCGAKTLSVFRRTIEAGKLLDFDAGDDYHVFYIMKSPTKGTVQFAGETHAAEEGAGVLLVPGESVRFEVEGSDMDVLHMAVPKPPAAVDEGLAGGPGYFFNRESLRPLSDASGGRVRRFCAESTVRLLDGSRLTPTNAIQAGEMHYHAGGSSPYHSHVGTAANPAGPSHCYMTFKGQGRVEVEGESQAIEPGTLVYFPPGVPHRLSAEGGPLDYFEIQAWRSFKTNVLSEEPLGLRWYYDPETPGGERVEWDQS